MARAPKVSPLSELEWGRVFDLRCKSKRGEMLSDDEMKIIVRAYQSDRRRYADMEPRVFEKTKPFGSF